MWMTVAAMLMANAAQDIACIAAAAAAAASAASAAARE
jgi:hypothetical protein